MAAKIEWLTPTDTTVRQIRVEASTGRTAAYTAVGTIDATTDGQQKGAYNSWVLEYVDSAGGTSTWYTVVFINSASSETTSDAVSGLPNIGRPYAVCNPGEGYLTGFQTNHFTDDEITLAQNAGDTFVEGKLKSTWHDSYPPDQVVDIASKWACANLIEQKLASESPQYSALARQLREEALELIHEILDGELALLEDEDGDGVAETFVDLGKNQKAKSGDDLKKYYRPTDNFYDLGDPEVPEADSDGDWY